MNQLAVHQGFGGTSMDGARLAKVVDLNDPMGLGRVQIQLSGTDPDNEAPQWARVATGFAGSNYGEFMIPDVGEEVIVVFLGGSARAPVVVGSLWNGATDLPEDAPADSTDRWTLTGKNGTRIAIVEESEGREKVEIETPGGRRIRVTDQGGGRITMRAGGSTIKIGPGGVEIQTGATVSIDASQITMSAGMVSVESGYTTFTGVVDCSMLITNSVISTSYTPGAGNIW